MFITIVKTALIGMCATIVIASAISAGIYVYVWFSKGYVDPAKLNSLRRLANLLSGIVAGLITFLFMTFKLVSKIYVLPTPYAEEDEDDDEMEEMRSMI